MTGEKRIYNADLLKAIHSLDKKLGEHLVFCKGQWTKIADLDEDIYGDNGSGIKHQHKTLWEEWEDEKEEQKEKKGDKNRTWLDVKTAVITFILITISNYALRVIGFTF